MAPNFLSKFVKTNGTLSSSSNTSDTHSRSRTISDVGSISRGRTISSAKTFPKVILTADGDEEHKPPSTPGSIHRSSSPRDRRPRAESELSSRSGSSRPTPISTPSRKPQDLTEMPQTTSPDSAEFPPNVQGLDVELGPPVPSSSSNTVASTGSEQIKHKTSSRSLTKSIPESAVSDTQYARRASVANGPPSSIAHSISGSDVASIIDSGAASSVTLANGASGFPSTSLHPRHRDSDAISIASSAVSTGKKMPWRRASGGGSNKKRKPTGLASAIAASGLAMAGTSVQHPLPTFSPQGPPPRSPPRSPPRPFNPRRPSTASRGNRSRASSGTYMNNGEDVNGSGEFESDMESESDEVANVDDIPVTGFAVASSKRNSDFHDLFPAVPEADYLIEDYGCALQKEILVQGRLYISENHVCFRANIFGWITDLSIPVHEIISIEKKMTAFVIPNAIQITTRTAKYTFASFLSRDTTFDVIHNIWRLARPDAESIASGEASARASFDDPRLSSGDLSGEGDETVRSLVPKVNKVTQCKCGKENSHYPESCMAAVFPGTPDKIYNLMFTSGFIKDFLRNDQKLKDLQISDWILDQDTKMLSRQFSYIKPLTASLGPKQTKCELKDETLHCDFDDYIVTLTTTRTPDVPSGGAFSVKTRTCIMWASSTSTRVVVTTQIEWTGRSYIKSIINSSALDGQRTYHVDLEKAMRSYISEHITEFLPEGVDDVAIIEGPLVKEDEALVTPTATGAFMSEEEANKRREQERNQRATQWAFDTIMGAWRVAKRSTLDALDLVSDAWDQSSSTTILWFVIVVLVFSNIWTLRKVGKREEVGRRKEMQKIEEREKWVQSIVAALWDERMARNPLVESFAPAIPANAPVQSHLKGEIADLTKMLDHVENRVQSLRHAIAKLDELD